MKIAKFWGVWNSELQNPSSDWQTIAVGDIRRRWLPACQNSKRSPQLGRGGVCVKYHSRVVFTTRRYAKRGICRRRVSVRSSACVCLSHSSIVSQEALLYGRGTARRACQ